MGSTKEMKHKCRRHIRAFSIWVSLFIALACISVTGALAQTSQIQGERDNTQVYSGVVYGPIDQNDTLWRIASRYKQDAQFTVYQTMMAIFELNPQAFENANFNTMVNGATLQLPSDRFIARIDPQRARAKADSDDRALGRRSTIPAITTANNQPAGNTNAEVPSSPLASANLKPDVPLVNKDDLSKTSSELQSQLSALRQQQQQQFLQLKNQVAASITSVEVLLEENKNLSTQLLQIDENNRKLTEKVETELQIQIDQQVEQLGQLIALVKEAEQRRLDKESESVWQLLSSPLALVIMMSAFTLMVIGGLAAFLLRKPATNNDSKAVSAASNDIVDDDLVIGEVNDQVDQDSQDLIAALGDDNSVEEDDILSDALEDDELVNSLNDSDMEVDLDGLDDMLVPDTPTEVADIKLGRDKNGAPRADDSDEILLDEDESISLDDNDTDAGLASTPSEVKPPRAQVDVFSLDDTDDETNGESEVPRGIDLDGNGEIDENTLEQIGRQIEQKDATITDMADAILAELDNGPDGVAPDNNQPTIANGRTDDAALGDSGAEADNTSDEKEDMLETLAELGESGDNANEDLDELSNELLLDLEEDSESQQELDELLDSIDSEVIEPIALGDDETEGLLDLSDEAVLAEDLENDQVTALADELLQELENESNEDDDLDDLLGDLDNKPLSLAENDDTGAPAASILDADDLLDDIPSFTSTMGNEDGDESGDEGGNEDEQPAAKDTLLEKTIPAPILEEIPDATRASQQDSLATQPTEPAQDPDSTTIASNTQHDPLDLLDETDDDVLAGLQGLDNWLDEDEPKEPSDRDDELGLLALSMEDDDFDELNSGSSLDDELIKGLDDANFDDMLNDLSLDNDDNEQGYNPDKNSLLTEAGLDLDALMTDVPEKMGTGKPEDEGGAREFVDVDDLLNESDSMAQMDDSDIDLDFERSLDKLVAQPQSLSSLTTSDIESDQASNLDLAQVYIDMEDHDAAKELLDEVLRLGNQEQQQEATTLISNMSSQP